jgi:hypothetical protein
MINVPDNDPKRLDERFRSPERQKPVDKAE